MEDCEFSDFSDDISYEENPFIDQVIEDNE